MTMATAVDDDLLDAVARVLEREGVRGLTVSAVAGEAGISRVTMHRRGVGIDELIVAVLGRASDDLRSSLWPVLTGAGDAASRLRTALGVLCEVAERHAPVMRAFFGEPARPLPERRDRTTSFEFIEPFERLLLDGTLDGSLCVDDPTRDATLVANSVFWTYLHMRHAHRWPPRRTTDRVVALATAHLTPR
jgi:AcrR family transcriptional regulator